MKTAQLPVLYFILAIMVAQRTAPPAYRWTHNTVSELAAQGLQYQWLMQAGFIGFGLLLNLAYVQKFLAARQVFLPDLLLMAYGLAILLSGFFSTAPFLAGVSFSSRESELHSLFATFAGIAFCAGIFYRIIIAPTPGEKWLHAIFLVLVVAASGLFGLSENGALPVGRGLIQRGLYLVSFLWLAFIS